jgi:hypothetical protein
MDGAGFPPQVRGWRGRVGPGGRGRDRGAVINGRFGVYGRGGRQGRRAAMPAGRATVGAPLFAVALR